MPSATLTPKKPFARKPLCQMIKPALMLCGLASTAAYADPNANYGPEAGETSSVLEEVVVSAEKRDANLQDVASSISAKTGSNLLDAEISTITELAQEIPNLHIFSWGGRRDSNIFIRGIGPGLFTDPTVGYYVDGVNYSHNGMFDMDLVDIERVEVLRGPQGTLYGGNSLGGVINVTTRQPGNETEGRVQLSADSLSQKKLITNFSTPLKEDELFFGVAFSTLQSDGHIDNTFLDKDFGERDDTTIRAKLRWLMNDNLEALLSLDYEKFRGDSYAMGPAAIIRDNPEDVSHDFEGEDNRDTLGTALTLKWSGENVDFTSITSWRDWENLNSADQDGGSMPSFVYHSLSEEEQTQITQELRWASNNSTGMRWIAGLYAYKSDVKGRNYATFSSLGGLLATSNATKDSQGYAAFGQLDFDLADNLVLTTGLRLDHEERKASYIQGGGNVLPAETLEFDELLPKLALSYTTAHDGLVYGSVSKGYRAGGFDTLYPNQINPSFDSETSINYELGYKSSFLEGRLDISIAAFLIDIEDQQIQRMDPNTFSIYTDNAGESRSKGIEFESRFALAEGWLMTLASSYTDATLLKYEGVNFNTFAVEDFSGNHLPNSPKFTASLSIQNRQPISDQLTLFTQVDNNYIGSFYFDAPNQFEQDAYNLLNLKAGIESESWQAYVWAKNALDEYYSKVEFSFGVGHTAEAGNPMSYGITVTTEF